MLPSRFDREALVAMFRLMSKREIDHVIDRAMHALSNSPVLLTQQNQVRSSDDLTNDQNVEFEYYYFIVTEGLKHQKGAKKKLWMAATPHIQAHHRAIQIQTQQNLDRRRGRIERVQRHQERQHQRAARQREIQARAARYRAQRARLAAEHGRMAAVALDIENLTTNYTATSLQEMARSLVRPVERIMPAPPRANSSSGTSSWSEALASLQSNHVVPRRVQGISPAVAAHLQQRR